MTTKLNILMTGVTGYIGGSILSRFLKRPDFNEFKITALVRSAEKAEKLRELGINVVVGSHSDLKLMEDLAAANEVVFSTTNSDDHPVIVATLKGMKRYHEETSKVPILIHTSGTGYLIDDAGGEYATETIYDDLDADQVNSLPDTAFHRPVDLEILKGDKEGYVRAYIVMPSTVWGIATGELVEKGIQNPHSMQVPQLILAALDVGRSLMMGQGKNIWPDVNIEDLGDLYIILFDAVRKGPIIGHGYHGIFFGENGEHSYYELTKKIGEALVALGRSDNPEPRTFTPEEHVKYFRGSRYPGTNG